MRHKLRVVLLICGVLGFCGLTLAASDTIQGLPIHQKTLCPGVIRLWVGDHVSSTAVTALATAKGIVVIDTTAIPVLDKAFRQIIARDLQRDDFRYLINTHGHSDHTNGNGVYADCQIIAHQSVADMMRDNYADIPRLVQWHEDNSRRLQAQLADGKLDERQRAVIQESLIGDVQSLEFLKSSPQPVLPTRTFTDRLTLDCGDTRFELYQSGGTHTRSDIFIWVPQKKLLFTGDMMADKWLTDSPGCLATFAVRSGSKEDYPVLVKNWQALVDRAADIEQYVPGHWNGELSAEGFKARFDYLKTMLVDLEALAGTSGDLEQYCRVNTLQKKFPRLADSPGFSDRGHRMTVNHLYRIYSGKISVADALQELLQGQNFTADFAVLRNKILQNRDRYFYTEAEINGTGYFLLNQAKSGDDAVRLFELNCELFPNSWNVYDSLAEGYYTQGDRKRALEFYEKSLQLNPANENGKKWIERLSRELR